MINNNNQALLSQRRVLDTTGSHLIVGRESSKPQPSSSEEIISLKARVERLEKESSEWYKMYVDTLMTYNDEEVSMAYTVLESYRSKIGTKIDQVREQKRLLKIELKNGRLDKIAYQEQMTLLNEQISELKGKISARLCELDDYFRAKGIRYDMIKDYMQNKKKK